MNIEVRASERTQKTKLSTSSIATSIRELTHEQMQPFLSNQWWSYLQTYGNRQRHGYAKGYTYPKITPQASRRDAWPPSGGLPAAISISAASSTSISTASSTAIMNPLGRRPGRATRTSSCRSRWRPPRTRRSSPTGPTRSRG